MEINKVIVGYLQTNCYLLFKNNNCLIIDPGAEENKIIKAIGDRKVVGILVTHYHPDHIGALEILKNKYNCMVYDKSSLVEKNYQVSDFNFDVIYTPGHKSDSLTYNFNNEYLFTGDFLFKETVGRYDLPTGDLNILMDSLEKIKKLNSSIIIYPGHGEDTTLDHEIKYNPFLNRY